MPAGKANHFDGAVLAGCLVEHTHVVHNVALDGDGGQGRVVSTFDLQARQSPVLKFVVGGRVVVLVVEDVVIVQIKDKLDSDKLRQGNRRFSPHCLPSRPSAC